MYIKDFGITMETLLAQDTLTQARLLAGANGLSRIVTTVRQIDKGVPAPSTSQGTFFLALQPFTQRETLALQDLLRDLSAAGASGLGLKGDNGPLPTAVLEAADRLALPLLELAGDISVPDVANQVLTFVLGNQSQTLNKIQDLNRALTLTMLHGGNLQEICKVLYQRFGNSVAISSDYLSSYVVNTTKEKRPYICAILEDEKRKAYSERTIPAEGVERLSDNLNGQACDRIVVFIRSDKVLHGRIYMWEDFKTVSAVELSVLESVTSLIALDIMKKTSILHIENSNRGGFLSDLLSSDRKQHQKALANARHFDFSPKAAHQVMVIRLRRQSRDALGDDALYHFSSSLIGILQPAVRNTVVKIVYANQGDQVILLLESTPSGGVALDQVIDDFVDNLYHRFERDGLSPMLDFGMGRAYKNPAELYKSLSEARRALSFPGRGVVRFEDMGIYRLLSHEGVMAEAELFSEQFLRPLLDYDQRKDASLISTLTAYYTCGGNYTRLAEHLGIHYNTVSNRLRKIQELTGLSLEDPDASLHLHVALKIHEMRSGESSGGTVCA